MQETEDESESVFWSADIYSHISMVKPPATCASQDDSFDREIPVDRTRCELSHKSLLLMLSVRCGLHVDVGVFAVFVPVMIECDWNTLQLASSREAALFACEFETFRVAPMHCAESLHAYSSSSPPRRPLRDASSRRRSVSRYSCSIEVDGSSSSRSVEALGRPRRLKQTRSIALVTQLNSYTLSITESGAGTAWPCRFRTRRCGSCDTAAHLFH